MKTRKRTQWLRLDNAAKVFPATSGKEDTKVFRVSCELKEMVDPDVLNQALQETLKEFPIFLSVIRRGLFWYYLETTKRTATVHEENRPPCSPIYDRNKKGLLFDVFYYNQGISLEVHHALTDGTGAMMFLNQLVIHYLEKKHDIKVIESGGNENSQTSLSLRRDDSFYRYYDDRNKDNITSDVTSKAVKAFRLRGPKLKEHRLKVVEGMMSVDAIKKLAKKHNTTVTVYLTAMLLNSICDVMTVRDKKHPVGMMVPVNLRSYFKSSSVRNFFGTIDVVYDFSKNSEAFDDVIRAVEQSFHTQLTQEKMKEKLNHLGALENNIVTRFVPLVIKDLVIKMVYEKSDSKYTFAISNVGKINLPEALNEFVNRYSVFVSTKKKQVCVCSYQDNLMVSFTSPLIGTEVERNFFRRLTEEGVGVEIAATTGWED